jgi:phosphatidylcholine synthase
MAKGNWRTQGRKLLRTFLGWCVHLYTALGLVCAAGIAVVLVEGGPGAFRTSFLLMLVATLIDATDGTFARAIRIREAVPSFDGRRLDDIVDFLTYTALPLLLIWRADILPQGQAAWLVLALLASVYGFCQVSVKTDDGYFLGFPSYWNLVALYLYLLHFHVFSLPGWFSLGIVIGFSLLTFVPSRYLYPSQKGRLNLVTNILGGLWAMLLAWILYRLPIEPSASDDSIRWLIVASLLFPIYYLVVSWTISVRMWLRQWRERRHSRREGVPVDDRAGITIARNEHRHRRTECDL